MEKWYSKTVKQTEEALKTDINTGLGKKEVKKRRAEDKSNDVYASSFKPIAHPLSRLFGDYSAIILVVTLLLAAVFDVKENIFVMAVLLIVYYIGMFIAYGRSEGFLKLMSENSLPTAKVLRDGRLYAVRQKELVRGDIIYLSTGDVVPCDARLIECNMLEVYEKNVTGMNVPIRKNAGFVDYHELSASGMRNMVFASTVVTNGTGSAICCETGADTEIRRKNRMKGVSRGAENEIMKSVEKFCGNWSIAVACGVVVLTLLSTLSSHASGGVFDSFLLALSSAVSMMSEFYVAFAFLSLACGIFFAVNRKGEVNRGALINYGARIDVLKDLDCLIVPRSSGICTSNVNIGYVFSKEDCYAPGQNGYGANVGRTLRYALLSTGQYGAEDFMKKNKTRDSVYDPEIECIINAARDQGEYNVTLEGKYPMLAHIDRGENSDFDITIVSYDGANRIALRGDINKVLPICTSYTDRYGKIYEITPRYREDLTGLVKKLEKEYYSVIAVASRDTIYSSFDKPGYLANGLILEGFIALREEALPEVAKNVSRCRAAGIRVIMLSDFEDERNLNLSASLGIINSPSEIISSKELGKQSEAIFRANTELYSVYVGLTLAQKKQLIKYLREDGKKVGTLCSELNEIVLISDSDIGFSHRLTVPLRSSALDVSDKKIAANASNSMQTRGSGCEALKFASDVIVSDPDIKTGTGGFNAMVESILSAKCIYKNMHRMIKYMLTSQTAKIVLVIASLFLPFMNVTPQQVLFFGLIIDFLALITIAFERPTYSLMTEKTDREKLIHPLKKNIPSIVVGAVIGALTIAVNFFMLHFGVINTPQVSGCLFVTFICCQAVVLSSYRRENGLADGEIHITGAWTCFILFIVLFIALLYLIPPFGEVFSVYGVSTAGAIGIALAPVLTFSTFEIIKLGNKIKKKKESVR